MKMFISAFFFPRFRVFIGLYSKARKRKRGNSLAKSSLLGSSVIRKNRTRLCLLIPFHLVLSDNYILRDFRGFRPGRLKPAFYLPASLRFTNLQTCVLHLPGEVIPGRRMVFIACAFGIFVDGNSSEEVLRGSPVF